VLNLGGFSITIPAGPGAAALAGQPVSLTQVNPPPGLHSNSQSTMSEEFQLQGTGLDNRLTWQGGVYYELSEPLGDSGSLAVNNAHCTNLNAFPPQCTNTFGILMPLLASFVNLGGAQLSQGHISYRNLGIYGQGTYDLTDQFKLTAGIRYTKDVTEGAGGAIVYNYAPNVVGPSCVDIRTSLVNNCFLAYRQESHAPTGVIDLDYTPVQNVMFYGKYSRGYRQGGVNIFGPTGYNTFAPERVDAYEIGAKTGFDGPVPGTFDIAAFYNDLSKQQLEIGFASANITANNLAVSSTTGIVNAGKSRLSGVEVDSSLLPFDNFRLDVNGAYLESKLVSEVVPVLPPGSPYSLVIPIARVGETLTQTPKYKVSVTGTYTVPVPESLGTLAVGATYVYTSKQRFSADPPYNFVGSTGILNLFVNWDAIEGSRFDASVLVSNATDLNYAQTIDSYFVPYGFAMRTPAPPRMFGVRLRYDFGEE
jgi:iron complex outermembrane receptor protein